MCAPNTSRSPFVDYVLLRSHSTLNQLDSNYFVQAAAAVETRVESSVQGVSPGCQSRSAVHETARGVRSGARSGVREGSLHDVRKDVGSGQLSSKPTRCSAQLTRTSFGITT